MATKKSKCLFFINNQSLIKKAKTEDKTYKGSSFGCIAIDT